MDSLPPCGGGLGWGVEPRGTEVPHLTTPAPNPAPQGGGEQFAAPSRLKLPPLGPTGTQPSLKREITMAEAGKELDGRVAIVTGSGRNIGRAIALALAAGGAAVVVNARSNRSEADAVVREIEGGGGTALAYLADVTNAAAVAAMVTAARARFGHIE